MQLLLKRIAKSLVYRTVSFLNRHPRLRATALAAVHRLGFARFARRTWTKVNSTTFLPNKAHWQTRSPLNVHHLSPCARQTFQALKDAIEKAKEKGI